MAYRKNTGVTIVIKTPNQTKRVGRTRRKSTRRKRY